MEKEKPGAIGVTELVLQVMAEDVSIVMEGLKNVLDATVKLD